MSLSIYDVGIGKIRVRYTGVPDRPDLALLSVLCRYLEDNPGYLPLFPRAIVHEAEAGDPEKQPQPIVYDLRQWLPLVGFDLPDRVTFLPKRKEPVMPSVPLSDDLPVPSPTTNLSTLEGIRDRAFALYQDESQTDEHRALAQSYWMWSEYEIDRVQRFLAGHACPVALTPSHFENAKGERWS